MRTSYRLDTDASAVNAEELYHSTAWQTATERPTYWVCGLAPNGYDTRFDLAGNALALCLGIGTAAERLATQNYCINFATTNKNGWLLPAFYPVIHPSDPDWHLLSNNYIYKFKNKPYHFHNGGIWFIHLGWLALGLRSFTQNNAVSAANIDLYAQMEAIIANEQPSAGTFYEYLSSDTLTSSGTPRLCFTAAGLLMAINSLFSKIMSNCL